MKLSPVCGLLILLAVSGCSSGTSDAPPVPSWKIVGNGVFENATDNVQLVFSGETPYLLYSYSETLSNEESFVKKFEGGVWNAVGTGSVITGVTGNASLAVYQATPYVAYTTDASPYLNVRKFDGVNWENVGDLGSVSVNAQSIKITVSSDGIPYVAFYDNDVDEPKIYRHESSWLPVGTIPPVENILSVVTMAMNGSTPYIAYAELDGSVHVLSYEESGWKEKGTSPGFMSSSFADFSLELRGGIPFVAFLDQNDEDKPVVFMYGDSTWKKIGSEAVSENSESSLSLAVSKSRVYVAYKRWGAGGDNSGIVKKDGGSVWQAVGESFSLSPIEKVFLTVKGEVPYVAYINEQSKVVVKKYE